MASLETRHRQCDALFGDARTSRTCFRSIQSQDRSGCRSSPRVGSGATTGRKHPDNSARTCIRICPSRLRPLPSPPSPQYASLVVGNGLRLAQIRPRGDPTRNGDQVFQAATPSAWSHCTLQKTSRRSRAKPALRLAEVQPATFALRPVTAEQDLVLA